jgi:RNA polymerase-binding transcription factor DksA
MTMHTVKLEPGRKEALRGLLEKLRGEAMRKARRAESMRAGGTGKTQAAADREIEANDRLGLIDDALQRLNRGTYGFCDECGEEIAIERLARSPFAPYCASCERKETR